MRFMASSVDAGGDNPEIRFPDVLISPLSFVSRQSAMAPRNRGVRMNQHLLKVSDVEDDVAEAPSTPEEMHRAGARSRSAASRT